MNPSLLLHLLVLLVLAALGHSDTDLKYVKGVSDHKEWKKLLKTRTNVLALFSNGENSVQNILPVFEKVAYAVRGQGTLLHVDCKSKEGKKLCKNLKVRPAMFELKHYKDGSFPRTMTGYCRRSPSRASCITQLPWSEDPTAANVKHIEGPNDFRNSFTRRRNQS